MSARAQSTMQAADRTGGAIIVAVSKRHDAARIEPALAAGARVFGENRVQEAASKWPALRLRYPDIELHLVGALQTNKAKDAVALFDVIQTVDRAKLARAIAAEAERQNRAPRVFVQVNTGEEPQKSGVLPAGADALIAEVRELRLELAGLMCLPPAGDDPAPHFEMLRDMAARHDLPALSMGMSGDFETAIAHGATHIRVGEAIFGPRPPQ
ncbi:MAG: YggS family pyridoxal phosphate-dependent enzyme [Pseudomonadota bacterium]